MNPFAVAMQGLGFGAAMAALQGLLQFVAAEVQKNEAAGGGIKTRRRVMTTQPYQYIAPSNVEEDEALLMLVGAL